MVKRYSVVKDFWGHFLRMGESSSGPWVKYSYVLSLEQEVTTLKSQLYLAIPMVKFWDDFNAGNGGYTLNQLEHDRDRLVDEIRD
jgi:hypothetical protein